MSPATSTLYFSDKAYISFKSVMSDLDNCILNVLFPFGLMIVPLVSKVFGMDMSPI